MRRLGADPDRRSDLAPAGSQPYGFARQLVALLADPLEFQLGLPGPVEHRPLLIAELSARPGHPPDSIKLV